MNFNTIGRMIEIVGNADLRSLHELCRTKRIKFKLWTSLMLNVQGVWKMKFDTEKRMIDIVGNADLRSLPGIALGISMSLEEL